MFNIVPFALFALAVSSVTALVVPRGPAAPANWASALEDYAGYHSRYMALGCYAKHNDPFFDRCCHPLKNGAQPNPSCQPPMGADGADNDNDNDDDCEEDSPMTPTSTTSAIATTSPTAAPHTTSATDAKATDDLNVNVNLIRGGVATFYYQGGNAGACGHYNSDNALIAAMDYRTYGNTNRKSPLCGRKVEITNTKNHKKVVVTVADACPTCKNKNSIDLSVHAFESIATKNEGEVPIAWRFL